MAAHLHFLLFLLPLVAAAREESAAATPATQVSPTVATILIVFVAVFFFSGIVFVTLRRIIDSGFCCGALYGGGAGGGSWRRRAPEGLSMDVIQKIPTYLYKDVKMHHRVVKGELECAVCLNQFEDQEALRLLPGCSHVFHPECVDPWLQSQATCPLCRAILHPSSNPKGLRSPASHPPNDIHELIITVDRRSPIQPLPNLSRPTEPDQTPPKPELPKPHSTGHTPLWTASGDDDRFTLRLPEEAVRSTWQLVRTRSRRKGYRSGKSWFGGRVNRGSKPDRFGLGGLNRTPPVSVLGSPLSDSGVCYVPSTITRCSPNINS